MCALLSQDSLLRILGGLLADHSSTSAAGSRAFGRRTTVLDGDRAAPCSSTSRGRLPPRADGARCCRHGPHKKNASLVTFCEAGNIVLPSPATSARVICIFHTSMPHLERCCCRRPPHVVRAFTVVPTSAELMVPSPLFRVLLLRHLRLPLPVAPRTCACRGRLDPLGDHTAACATSGVLASRALPLERAVASRPQCSPGRHEHRCSGLR